MNSYTFGYRNTQLSRSLNSFYFKGLVVPLLGKYLVFTITMVSISICLTIFILNIHYRTPELYKPMPRIIHNVFLIYLPKLLLMKTIEEEERTVTELKRRSLLDTGLESIKKLSTIYETSLTLNKDPVRLLPHNEKPILINIKKVAYISSSSNNREKRLAKPNKFQILIKENIFYLTEIINFLENDHKDKMVIQQWRLLANILDQVTFLLFGSAFLIGTLYIFLQAPSLYYGQFNRSETNICVVSDEDILS